jgi:hypothetical protein
MTSPANLARATAVHFEAKKTGFGQAQDGWSLTLRIQHDDVPAAVRDAKKGTRYVVALVEIGDDELPVVGKKSRAQMAGILCNDPAFHAFLAGGRCPPRLLGVTIDTNTAAMAVREICEVESRADLDRDEFAAEQWDALYTEFRRSQPVPDEHLPARIG